MKMVIEGRGSGKGRGLLLVLVCLLLARPITVAAFNVNLLARQLCSSHVCSSSSFGVGRHHESSLPSSSRGGRRGRSRTTTTMMVFDFFKKRTEEGLRQAANFQKKTAEGKIGEAFTDVGQYVKERQDAVAVGLAKSRERLLSDLNRLIGASDDVAETLKSLEEVLIMADIGMTTTTQVIKDLKAMAKMQGEKPLQPDDIKSVLRGTLVDVLRCDELSDGSKASSLSFNDFQSDSCSDDNSCSSTTRSLEALPASSLEGGDGQPSGTPSHQPTVFFVMGANGMGKTTTIGKMAYRLRTEGGQKVLLAAADTFRAAAVDQLVEWANRAEVDILVPKSKEERPAAVTFRACEKAIQDKYDVLIVDTSGRLSNNRVLTDELNGMKRVITKAVPGGPPGSGLGLPGPHETLLVVDAAVGRNAVDQARTWKKDVGLTGLVVTKLDGTARAGFTVSISRELDIPVKLIGVGEKITDLKDFEPEEFVDSLLGYTKEEAARLAKKFSENPILQERLAEKLAAAKLAREEKLKKASTMAKISVTGNTSSKARKRQEKKAAAAAAGKPKGKKAKKK